MSLRKLPKQLITYSLWCITTTPRCVQKPQQVRHRLLLMNLEDYQIWKLTDSVLVSFPSCAFLSFSPPCLSTTHNKLWEISLACCGLIFYCLTQLCCIWPSVWVLPFQIGVLHIKSLALKRGKMMCDTYAAILQVLPFWKMQGSGSSSRYHTQRAFFLCKMCFYSLPGFCVWMKRLQDSNCRCVTYNVTT